MLETTSAVWRFSDARHARARTSAAAWPPVIGSAIGSTIMSRFWSPVVHSLSPYTPGEQPKQDGIVKLNIDESPYPLSPRVLAAIASATDRLRLYPDPRASALRETIAAHYGVAPEFCSV